MVWIGFLLLIFCVIFYKEIAQITRLIRYRLGVIWEGFWE